MHVQIISASYRHRFCFIRPLSELIRWPSYICFVLLFKVLIIQKHFRIFILISLTRKYRFIYLIAIIAENGSFGYSYFYAQAIRRMRKGIKRCPCRACVRASVRPGPFVHHLSGVLCERNSSYNFIPILLKLYRCFCQGLKMCMTFGYNPQINFCHIFHSLNLVIFRAQLLLKLMDIRVPLWAQLLLQFLSQSFWKLYRCFLPRTEDVHDIWI